MGVSNPANWATLKNKPDNWGVDSFGLFKVIAGVSQLGTCAGSNITATNTQGTAAGSAQSGTWKCLGYAPTAGDVCLFKLVL